MEQQRIGTPGGTMTNTPGASSAGPSTTGIHNTTSMAANVAKEQGHRALDRLRQNAISKVEDQKAVASHHVEQLAHGLRRTGETLQREGSEPLGRLASTAADSVERLGGYLNRTDVNGLARDFGTLARRNPAVVFGTALLAGVLVGRFLRSSSAPEKEVVFEPDVSLLDPTASMGSTGLGTTGLGSAGSAGIGNGTTPSSTTFGGEPPTGGWA